MSDNSELMTAVSAATEEYDPADFDVTNWLTPVNQKEHRRYENVTVIRDFSLVPEIQELNDLQFKIDKQQAKKANDPDASIADGNPSAHLEARKVELIEKIEKASITLKVYAMLQHEINDAVGDMTPTDPMYWPSVFAESIIFPHGKTLPLQQWPQFRNTIGDAQMGALIDAFKTVCFQKLPISAPF